MATFIGSSRQSQLEATRIAAILADSDHPVIPWWSAAAFAGADYRLERLLGLSKLCDSAVFVVRAGDTNWPREDRRGGEGQSGIVANDHSVIDDLILECGIFISRFGLERLFILTDQVVRNLLPSEMRDRVVFLDTDAPERVSRELTALADNLQLPARLDISVYTRKREHEIKPDGHSAKIVYHGIRGAEAWKALERDAKYSQRRSQDHVSHFLASSPISAELNKCRNIISFGPGIGKNDCEVIAGIHFKTAQYIPVDINFYLAVFAAHRVDEGNLTVRAVNAIVADFEENWMFIAETVRRCAIGPKLYMMLGGTFGNLESGENRFLENISALMEEGDFFVLDSFFATSEYRVENDPLMDPSTYTKKMREFLANGIAQREKISLREALSKFDDLIDVDREEETSDEISGHIIIRAKPSGDTVMSVKRHDVQTILEMAGLKKLRLRANSAVPIGHGRSRHVLVFTRDPDDTSVPAGGEPATPSVTASGVIERGTRAT